MHVSYRYCHDMIEYIRTLAVQYCMPVPEVAFEPWTVFLSLTVPRPLCYSHFTPTPWPPFFYYFDLPNSTHELTKPQQLSHFSHHRI